MRPIKTEISPQVDRVGAGIIGATKRSLTELREERDQLLKSVKNGEVVLSLDSNSIDPSPFIDRLPDDDSDGFDKFKSLLAEEGQIVPITVRKNPQDVNRHQIVYGHRRYQALRELGMDVKAILRDYSDRELAVAQGIENASRQDLTWIEKALFAATMERAGLKAKDIRAALSVDDAQLSKFRTVFNELGVDVIRLIGRAPKVGRPRWLDFISLIKKHAAHVDLQDILSDDKVLALSSDERFMVAVSMFSVKGKENRRNPRRLLKTSERLGRLNLVCETSVSHCEVNMLQASAHL